MRRSEERKGRPWRRRSSKPATDPATVVRELQRRRLGSLEDCRIAWEQGADPLAVCVAVMKSDLPRWLVDALLILLYGAPLVPRSRGRTMLQKLWAQRERDAVDAKRAWEVARARSHPEAWQTWEVSYRFAKYVIERQAAELGMDLSGVSEEAMKKSYRLVAARLREDGRYYWAEDGFSEQLRALRDRLDSSGLPQEE